MSRYFFHVMNGKAVIDIDGVELADMEKVRAEAVRAAGEMLASGNQVWKGEAWQMFVTDSTEALVFSVSFSIDRHGI